ncbi:hypothetical protein [Specibacter sp. RAF43]|uniref:hypothetical protein n=1 Tax=Specibacter sp. RAF43 TaxID=3233057 RepID=UPI003F983DD8
MSPTRQIRITEKNRAALEAALAEANGRLDRFLSISDLLEAARVAEEKLDRLALRLVDRPGAVAHTAEPASPWSQHFVTVAKATLIRRPSGWFLQSAGRGTGSGHDVQVEILAGQFDLGRLMDQMGVHMAPADTAPEPAAAPLNLVA